MHMPMAITRSCIRYVTGHDSIAITLPVAAMAQVHVDSPAGIARERSLTAGRTGRKLPSMSRVNVPELRTGVNSGLSTPSRGQTPRRLPPRGSNER